MQMPSRRLILYNLAPVSSFLSALAELGWLKGPAADEYPPTVLASAAPPPKQGPWLQAHRDVEVQEDDGSIVPRTAMSEREMELIMLGGAEP